MMIDRRLLVLPALAALAARNADAFTPASFGGRTAANSVRSFSMVSTETEVSVEYDSAARLAYKDWCGKFNKEASDERFETFKANYEAITVANVSAAKKARDEGSDRPKDLELNEFGDMSEKEYLEMQSGGNASPAEETPAAPSPMDSIMEATMAQSDASSALAEAADAMAEEEEQLVEALGLDSIEELEEAIDSMQGIDSEGVEVDTSDVREVRVRAAYMDWCKEYGKQPDEARFPTFSSNFLAMEEYANENGREMVLNKYADCTEEEYRQLTNTAAPAPELVVEAPVEKKPEAPKKAEEPKVEAPKKEEPKAEAPKKEEPKVEAKVEKPKPAPKAPPKPEPVLSLEEEAILKAKAAAEAEAAQIAKRRELDEQAAQMEREKAAAAMKKQQQAVVPTPPKVKPTESKEEGNIFSSLFQSTPKKETPAAKKESAPAKDDKTAAEARLKAAGAVVAKQRKMEQQAIKTGKAPPKEGAKAPPKKDEGAGILGSIFGGASSEKAPAKPTPAKPTPPAPAKAEKKAETSNPFSFLQASEKPKAKAAPEPPKVSAPPKKPDIDMAPNAMTEALNSFFGSSKAPTPVAPPKPEPVVETPKPKSQPFNLFGGKPAEKKAAEVKPAAPKPAPVRKPSPTLSLFGGASPKPAPKAPPAPVSAPAPKGSGTFSLFSSPSPAKKADPVPAPTPVAKKPAPAFGGFFGASSPKPAPKAPEPVEKAPVKGSGTFSLFGGGATTPPKPVAQKPPVVKKAPVKKATTNGVAGIGGFGSFGAPKKTVKQPVRAAGTISVSKQARGPGTISISQKKSTPPPAPVAKRSPAKGSGTFSLFGGSSPAPTPAPEPVQAQKTPARGSGTFSIFGGGAAKAATPAPEPVKPKAVAKSSGGFFGGAKKAAPKVANDGIPILSKFRQNRDGSITGLVRNSKSFKNGTEITTSPVRRGAKSGDVVTTSSGSKYRLE